MTPTMRERLEALQARRKSGLDHRLADDALALASEAMAELVTTRHERNAAEARVQSVELQAREDVAPLRGELEATKIQRDAALVESSTLRNHIGHDQAAHVMWLERRRLIVGELSLADVVKERDTLRAECERLKADNENLLWNLAGCDTIASSQRPQDFTHEGARPALHAVQRLAVECERLLAAAENAPWKASYMAMRDERDRLTARVASLEAENRDFREQLAMKVTSCAVLHDQLNVTKEKLHHADLAAGALRSLTLADLQVNPIGVWERLQKALSASPATLAGEVSAALDYLLTRIGSWTNARWDQHLRYEFGDEKAQKMIDALTSLAPVVARWGGSR